MNYSNISNELPSVKETITYHAVDYDEESTFSEIL